MKKYNPDIHHRRSIRLKGYDYSQAGAYYITICMQNRVCRLGQIRNGMIGLSKAGLMVWKTWLEIPEFYPGVEIDEFIVMPNHVHGIIVLTNRKNETASSKKNVGTGPRACPGWDTHVHGSGQPQGVVPTLGDIVGRFKSFTTTLYIDGVKNAGWPPYEKKLWQKDYYDHIIRNEDELHRIREYIFYNSLKWDNDPENLDARIIKPDELWMV